MPGHSTSPEGRFRGMSKGMGQRIHIVSEESLVRNHRDPREHLV